MKKFLTGFAFAFSGIVYTIRSQRNMRVHLLAVLVVCVFGFYFSITTAEWLAVLLCCALVISLEMVNTAFELFADKLHPEKNEQIRKVKDVAAGAVLVAAVFAIVIAVIVFGKYILAFYE